MRTPNKKANKQARATAEQLAKYGPNARRNLHDYAPVRRRLQFVCDVAFSSNTHEMALAAGVCYRQCRRILTGHAKLTVPMASQFISRLGLRAEWLITGAGQMFPTADTDEHFLYLPRLQTTYRTFDTLDAHAVYPNECEICDIAPAAAKFELPTLYPSQTDRFSAVARAIFSARINQKPVCFFLDSDYISRDTQNLWHELFVNEHANMLVMTLAGLFTDLSFVSTQQPVDINAAALAAARQGAGYGETILRLAYADNADQRQASLFLHAGDLGFPVFVAAELGEIAAHTNPAVRAPELGAAIGAAAYVDLLGFSAQLDRFFGQPCGVFISAASPQRSARWLLSRLRSISNSVSNELVFVCFANELELDSSTGIALQNLMQHGVCVHVLPAFDNHVLRTLSCYCQSIFLGVVNDQH